MVQYGSDASQYSCKSLPAQQSNSTDMKIVVIAGIVFLLAAILLAVCHTNDLKNDVDVSEDKLKNILIGLLTSDKKHSHVRSTKVAVGYGHCQDLVFEALEMKLFNCSRTNGDSEMDIIRSFDDLEQTFCYYFRHGAAAERYINIGSLFDDLVTKARNLNSSRVNIGGNAPFISRRFAMYGFNVLLAASATPAFKRMLPSSIQYAGSDTMMDDVHLIFEYKTGDKCGPFEAPRANRFILHHDVHGPKFTSMAAFGKRLIDFQPNLLVIGGLQILDFIPLDNEVIDEKLTQVSQQMKSQPPSTLIHFEMASVTDKNLLNKMVKLIIPGADSIGMNEQELANLHGLLRHNEISRAVDSDPSVASTLDKMRFIASRIESLENQTINCRPLTRIHVHTLAFQLLMVKQNSPWKHADAAVARASLVANTHVCNTDEVDLSKATIKMDLEYAVSDDPNGHRFKLNSRQPVTCWNERTFHFCIAPNIVCTEVRQTAGGGDNISAAGLTAQI